MGESAATRTDATDLLSLLADPECRAILELTATTARSVAELVEACDLPPSTAYRKVEALVEAGLLEERVRIQPAQRNPREYLLREGTITLTLDGAGGPLPDYALDADAGVPATCESSDGTPAQVEASTDGGGHRDDAAEPREDSFRALLLEVAGAEDVVERYEPTPATASDTGAASVAATGTAVAREDGFAETIDDPDDSQPADRIRPSHR